MNTKHSCLHVFLLISSITLIVGTLHAEIVTVGNATYRTDLPDDEQGNPRRAIPVAPLVSESITGVIPTNDWWSSLVWPANSPYSMPMFAHPLALQAHGDGLGMGYNPNPVVSHSYRDGKRFQIGTDYRYPYRETLHVGLEGMESEDAVLDGYGDWSVTALWKQGADELRATFAHGSPFVYLERTSDKPIRVRFKAPPINRNDQPIAPLVYEATGLNSKHTGEPGGFELTVNAGKHPGIGSRARLVYDFNGDGETDRVETFNLFATDPVPDTWETYSTEKQTLDERLTHGDMQDFRNGSVRLEFWKCFGEGPLELQHAKSHVTLPVRDGRRFLRAEGGLAKFSQDSIGRLEGDEQPEGPGQVFYRDQNVLGVTVRGTHYGLFAPTGSAWSSDADSLDELITDLNGKDYISIAVLPDSKEATVRWFGRHAFAFLTDTRIDYRYDREASSAVTTFTATTEVKEGEASDTVFALCRHQYTNMAEPQSLAEFSYISPRGEMRVVSGESFETVTPYTGVLPALPMPGSRHVLMDLLETFYNDVSSREQPLDREDTYWSGKELGKFAEVIQIADQLGQTRVRDELIEMLKRRLEDWADCREGLFFRYDETWGTLTGYPDSYGSSDQLNDHHFHYSYFIKAAATIAQYDPDWVRPENYGGFIDLLIRDCANYDREDNRFPWMRFFDPYAGHSWASGHSGFASGNNQESSSESMNFATSLILYGEATGNETIRDLGIYWHATEAQAIRHYWFDVDQAVFPEDYGHSCVGMVWGDGGTYGTFWTANPEEIHGINYLPLNGGSLYLARDPDYILRNFNNMLESNHSFHTLGFEGDPDNIDKWHDILAQYLALADPEEAIQQYEAAGGTDSGEFGETRLHTVHWLKSLKRFGRFDPSVRADHPTAVVFSKDGVRTYIIYHAGTSPIRVGFSDGQAFVAEPGLHTYSE